MLSFIIGFMKNWRLMRMAPLVIVGAVAAGACGGITAPGVGTPFCADVSTLASGLVASGSALELSFLKANQAKFNDLGPIAPAAVRSDVQIFLVAAHNALATNDSAPVQTSLVETASGKIKSYCGIKS